MELVVAVRTRGRQRKSSVGRLVRVLRKVGCAPDAGCARLVQVERLDDARAIVAQLELLELLDALGPVLTTEQQGLASPASSPARQWLAPWLGAPVATVKRQHRDVLGGWHVTVVSGRGPRRARGGRTDAGKRLLCVEVRSQRLLFLSGADVRWGEMLALELNLRVGLISSNAYISTLGGGHFLCKHIDAAIGMAVKQHAIARQLGDATLACQTRVHLAYNLMQRGQLRAAKYLLRREWAVAHALRNGLLKSMVAAAWHYAKKLRAIRHELTAAPADSPLQDGLYRQRFVAPVQ